MAIKNDLFDFDEATASNNDNIEGANIAENCAPSGINNAIRGLAAIVKRAVGSQGNAIASAATTAIGAPGTALYTTVTGTTTITSFGAVGAGTLRIIEFTGSLTLTHNATSLRLPGAGNILTAAGDVGFFVSLGAGNWKCLHFSRANGSAVASFNGTLTSTSPNAPAFESFCDRIPAAGEELGEMRFVGRDSTGNQETYGFLNAIVLDPTSGSEDGNIRVVARVSGTPQAVIQANSGVQIGSATGGFKGLGTLNAAAGVYIEGHGTIAQCLTSSYTAYGGLTAIIPSDNTIPQITEGTEIITQAITPVNASSTILITVSVFGGGSAPNVLATAALFVDASSNALACACQGVAGTAVTIAFPLVHAQGAASISTRTYRLRIGPDAGTMYTNGLPSGRLFGGVAKITMTVLEILPQ